MRKIIKYIIFIVSLILTIVSLLLAVHFMSRREMFDKNVFAMAIEFSAMMVFTTFIGGCILDKTGENEANNKFILFLFTMVRTMFYDFVIWIVDGINSPVFVSLNYTFNILYFLVNVSLVISFVECFVSTLSIKKKYEKIYFSIAKIYRIVLFILLMINFKYEFIFSVNDGVYERGTLIPFIFGMIGILVLGIIPFFDLNKMDYNAKYVLITYIALPFISTFLQLFVSEVAFAPIGLFASTCIVYVHGHIHQKRIIKEQEYELEKEKTRIMISQIQPHFLYNTLTTISYLCKKDPLEAQRLTVMFSKYLRANIDFLSKDEEVPFEKELLNVENYVAIEKCRFEERVNVVYDIKVKDFNVPMLSVQPIVENAIKHGICNKEEGGTVWISSKEEEKFYLITVKDDGVGYDRDGLIKDGKVHVGEKNVIKRIEAIGGTVNIISKISLGTTVYIRIPKREEE